MKTLLIASTIALAFLQPSVANVLELDIHKAAAVNPYAIAVVPFAGDDIVTQIINTNLNHTELKSTSHNLPAMPTDDPTQRLRWQHWQAAGFLYVVAGDVQKTSTGQTAIGFEVIELGTGRSMGRQIQLADSTPQGLRHAAHVVSDRIYELITGTAGDFSGRIAYVEELGRTKSKQSRLMVMDADGQNVRVIHSVQGSLFSPTWAPDGRRVAYAEQRPNGLPVIYIHDVDSGTRQLLTPFKGNNLGASFSPDGSRLIFSGSHENNDPAIYEVDIASGFSKKITHMTGAENSPSFAPDGQSFVFTADNGSRTPQLYRYNRITGQATRLSAGMAFNPRISPDGQKIAYVAGSTLMLIHSDGSRQAIAPSYAHESASFSPNSKRIVFANPQGLSIRHLQTGTSFQINSRQGRIREPAWSKTP